LLFLWGLLALEFHYQSVIYSAFADFIRNINFNANKPNDDGHFPQKVYYPNSCQSRVIENDKTHGPDAIKQVCQSNALNENWPVFLDNKKTCR
jgi:hypothetical protein